MFRKFKIAALMAIAVLVLLIPITVYADESVTKEFSAEAEDGAVFSLIYNVRDDGTLEFAYYKLITEAIPKDEKDFPPQDGKGPYFNSEHEVWHAELDKNEIIAEVPRFSVKFPEREIGLISIEGVKYYIIDTKAQTVRYAGAEIEYEEIVDPNEPVEEATADEAFYVTAEDGVDGYILMYPDGETFGYEIGTSEPADIYDFPEYQGGTGTYYSSAEEIPLGENQVLCEIEYSAYLENVGWSLGKKFYIVDYENKTLTYAGHSEKQFICNEPTEHGSSDAPAGTADGGIPASDGVTVPANTGNSSTSAIVAAIALGAIFFSKKVK